MFWTLAYGGFDFAHPANDYVDTLWGLFILIMLALTAYVPSSLIAQKLKGGLRLLGLLVFGGIFMLISPTLGVMGEFGPAHVAMHVGIWAFPLFFVTLIAKIIILMFKEPHWTKQDDDVSPVSRRASPTRAPMPGGHAGPT